MFDTSHPTTPDDISTRHAPQLTKMHSSQVTHVIHHMFDGITHNAHNTNGAIGRMRKDFPAVDAIGQASPHGMTDNNMCNGGGPGAGHYQAAHHNSGPHLTDMNGVPHGLVGGMMSGMDGHYGNSFQLSANVQAEAAAAAQMNEEERRRRFGMGSVADGRIPPLGDFESTMVAKLPFRHEGGGAAKSSAEEDEEDEDDYDDDFEDSRTAEVGKPVSKRRKMQFNCFQCPKSYRSRKSLVAHHKKHPGFCGDCGVKRGFALDEVIAHNTQHHIAQYPFICEECGESFRRNQQFKHHHASVHGRDQWHTCPECSESFPTLAVYRKHLADKNHTDNPAICDICGDRFNGLPLLKKHVLKMHKQDAKKYGCKYCEKSFTLKSNLERHMRMHTEVQKGFICEKCGTEYFSSQALKDHCNQAHVEMKPFECNFCKKRFSHQRSLRKHAQSHSEERPFVCDICVQAFKHKTHLVRHKQSVHHEQPAKKKAKRMQENSKGELVPVAEPKAPTAKASSSKNKQSVAQPVGGDSAKQHFQAYPENHMFFNTADQQQQHDHKLNPALPANSSVPMQQQAQPHHSNMHGYGPQPGRPQPPHPHLTHPHLHHPQHPNNHHPNIPSHGPHPQNHHQLPQSHQQPPPHHPQMHQNPMLHHHPQYHHPHHPHMQPHQMQQQSPHHPPLQSPHHPPQQSPHLTPLHANRPMPNNHGAFAAPMPDGNHIGQFGMNNNNNSHRNNANMFHHHQQQQQQQQQQQHFQPNAAPPNHDHYQSSFVFKNEPQPLAAQHNHHQLPVANPPHIKLEPYANDDPASRPGSATNYAASPFDQQTSSWNAGASAAGGAAAAPPASGGATPGAADPNKMFSMVDMAPPFVKQELNDVDLMQYPNLWDSTEAPTNNTQPQTMSYVEPPSSNSYNTIGSILSNLELLGNNATYDAASFDMIANNFEQAQQAPKPPQQQPLAVASPQTTPHHQQHQTTVVGQPPPNAQMHQMHQLQRHAQHPNQLPHPHPNNKPNQLNHSTGLMNPADAGMAYYHNQPHGGPSPLHYPPAPPHHQPLLAAQSSQHEHNNNSTIGGYAQQPPHTITDISNTYLTDNQRTNLQQHVDYNHLQPTTTSVAMPSPATNNGNFYAVGGPMAAAGGGGQVTAVKPLGGSGGPEIGTGANQMAPPMAEYMHNNAM